jgi:hypothetical protein
MASSRRAWRADQAAILPNLSPALTGESPAFTGKG